MNFSEVLTQWYHANRRDLPWRNTTNAYLIWLSEIILQQTRVEQGMPYYYRFAEKYPTVSAFAEANEGEVLKLWQGLGYYSRGRNMLVTSRLVTEKFGGVFPGSYADLITLKGIGEYTAAAISSFATNEAKAVVDGNVSRVIARYFGIYEPINSTAGKKLFQQEANKLLNHEAPGLHNQAMMEFGAMLCKPRNPKCNECPVNYGCYAFNNKQINSLPVKLKTVKIKERFFNYFLVTDGEEVLLNKRSDNDIWANMYDFPLIETPELYTEQQLFYSLQFANMFGADSVVKHVSNVQKHVLTHQNIYYRFVSLKLDARNKKYIKLEPTWFFTKVKNLSSLAVPKIIFSFLTNNFEF